ncbi:hypothetical protein EVAR_66152_1 [Eumeta japonica]|uniref:Uncharacterized protein n=1 Tax=Eumeta variegata TaxID=151549 RepID=A0A4C1YVX7_EUMVA|nr:hypothetical protein EVAR_66152_1 [Eumeta japonica]
MERGNNATNQPITQWRRSVVASGLTSPIEQSRKTTTHSRSTLIIRDSTKDGEVVQSALIMAVFVRVCVLWASVRANLDLARGDASAAPRRIEPASYIFT